MVKRSVERFPKQRDVFRVVCVYEKEACLPAIRRTRRSDR